MLIYKSSLYLIYLHKIRITSIYQSPSFFLFVWKLMMFFFYALENRRPETIRQRIKNQTRFIKCQNRNLKKKDMRMQFIFMFYQRETDIKYNRLNPIARLISKESELQCIKFIVCIVYRKIIYSGLKICKIVPSSRWRVPLMQLVQNWF